MNAVGTKGLRVCRALDIHVQAALTQLGQVIGDGPLGQLTVRNRCDDGIRLRQVLPLDELDAVLVPGLAGRGERVVHMHGH